MKTLEQIAYRLGQPRQSDVQRVQLMRFFLPERSAIYQNVYIRCKFNALHIDDQKKICQEIITYAEDALEHLEAHDIWPFVCREIVETLLWVLDMTVDVPLSEEQRWFEQAAYQANTLL